MPPPVTGVRGELRKPPCYQKIIDEFPQKAVGAYYNLTQLALREGQYPLAIETARHAVVQFPARASLYRMLAFVGLKAGNEDLLRSAFDGLSEKTPPSLRSLQFLYDLAQLGIYPHKFNFLIRHLEASEEFTSTELARFKIKPSEPPDRDALIEKWSNLPISSIYEGLDTVGIDRTARRVTRQGGHDGR